MAAGRFVNYGFHMAAHDPPSVLSDLRFPGFRARAVLGMLTYTGARSSVSPFPEALVGPAGPTAVGTT